jgi:hypothetical protein
LWTRFEPGILMHSRCEHSDITIAAFESLLIYPKRASRDGKHDLMDVNQRGTQRTLVQTLAA